MEEQALTVILNEIQALRSEVSSATLFIKELKNDYSVMEDTVALNSNDVMRLLGISRATLARWREARVVPFNYVSCNHVVYPFKGLYLAIKTGKATFKGFRRIEALQRLNAYREGIIKGYMGDDTTIFEEL